jgi:hypothetical protein
MKKMKTEEILKKLKELEDYEIRNFIHSLDLTKEQFEILAEDEDPWVREQIAERPDLPDDLTIRSCCDSAYWGTSYECYKILEKLSNLKSEDLENAYDLIRTSKYISRKDFKYIFNYIISNFPELSEAAKLFKSILLKGKKDLK